jgi:SAM-dependent methyltransferase
VEQAAYSNIFEIEEKLWWYKGRRRVCFDLLKRFLAPDAERQILDVGCGTGYNLSLLRKYGKVQGVDMSPEALKFCRERGETDVTLHSAGELPFESASFDLVTAFDVLEHIEDDRGTLEEFGRLLTQGGWLLIYTPALPWLFNEHDRLVHHKRRYLKGELKEKIVQAGYQIEHISYVNLLILPIVLLARVFYRLKPQRHAEMLLTPEPFNSIFTALSYFEARLVNGPTLPYGMTLVALARKV